jgi:dienelactone hydrolase
MDEVTVRNVPYRTAGDTTLTMDLYYPPGMEGDARLPAVVIAAGYPDAAVLQFVGSKFKDYGGNASMARLFAAFGLVAIAYEVQQPDADLEAAVAYVRQNAPDLNLDGDRLAIWAGSMNGSTAMWYVQQGAREFIQCAVFYNAHMPTPDGKLRPQISAACEPVGCYSAQLPQLEMLRADLPLFAVRGGRDNVPLINDSIDHFASQAPASGVPLTFVEYPEGRHAWYLEQDTERSREIIKQTLGFLEAHLLHE